MEIDDNIIKPDKDNSGMLDELVKSGLPGRERAKTFTDDI
jgi:hypothetical protein